MSKKFTLCCLLCYVMRCFVCLVYNNFLALSFIRSVCARDHRAKIGALRSISLALSCTACTIYAQFSFERTKRNILKL